jgi:hypothetical protein
LEKFDNIWIYGQNGKIMKKVYSRPTERDAVLLTDLEGDSIEISGQDMISAKLQRDGFNTLYRRVALPHFCKDGGDLEVISMVTKKILWSSVLTPSA